MCYGARSQSLQLLKDILTMIEGVPGKVPSADQSTSAAEGTDPDTLDGEVEPSTADQAEATGSSPTKPTTLGDITSSEATGSNHTEPATLGDNTSTEAAGSDHTEPATLVDITSSEATGSDRTEPATLVDNTSTEATGSDRTEPATLVDNTSTEATGSDHTDSEPTDPHSHIVPHPPNPGNPDEAETQVPFPMEEIAKDLASSSAGKKALPPVPIFDAEGAIAAVDPLPMAQVDDEVDEVTAPPSVSVDGQKTHMISKAEIIGFVGMHFGISVEMCVVLPLYPDPKPYP